MKEKKCTVNKAKEKKTRKRKAKAIDDFPELTEKNNISSIFGPHIQPLNKLPEIQTQISKLNKDLVPTEDIPALKQLPIPGSYQLPTDIEFPLRRPPPRAYEPKSSYKNYAKKCQQIQKKSPECTQFEILK